MVTDTAMNDLRIEIQEFLAETGMSQRELARMSHVAHTAISFLVTGRRKDVMRQTADKLRTAMTMVRAQEALESGKA